MAGSRISEMALVMLVSVAVVTDVRSSGFFLSFQQFTGNTVQRSLRNMLLHTKLRHRHYKRVQRRGLKFLPAAG